MNIFQIWTFFKTKHFLKLNIFSIWTQIQLLNDFYFWIIFKIFNNLLFLINFNFEQFFNMYIIQIWILLKLENFVYPFFKKKLNIF
jgi:hypothetical protein